MATNWQKIRAEYIGGGISQRKLAAKYGVSYPSLRFKAEQEGWVKDREETERKAMAITTQKIAAAKSDNAAIAQRIKTKLLRKLEKEIDALPDSIGSETRNTVTESSAAKGTRTRKEASKAYNIRDLAMAYKQLTDDMNLNSSDEQVRIIIDV